MSDRKDAERRQRSLTDADVEALLKVFEDSHCIPTEMHKAHHAFIESWIAKEQRKQEIWDKAKAHVLGWGLVAVLTGAGYASWDWVKANLGR